MPKYRYRELFRSSSNLRFDARSLHRGILRLLERPGVTSKSTPEVYPRDWMASYCGTSLGSFASTECVAERKLALPVALRCFGSSPRIGGRSRKGRRSILERDCSRS